MATIINLFPTTSQERKFFIPDPWLTLKEEILALTLFGGGFPSNIILLETIALSVMTRTTNGTFGDDVVAVCLQKNQYRAWQEFGHVMGHFYRASQQRDDFQICRRIARRAVKNVITLSPRIRFFADVAPQNPTHFHHVEDRPDWSRERSPLFLLDNYFFYGA